ncbi:hypothetical protein EMPG_13199, partial [Blastomyces silverae]
MMNIINTDLSVKEFIIILKDLVSFNTVMKVSELHAKNFIKSIEQLQDIIQKTYQDNDNTFMIQYLYEILNNVLFSDDLDTSVHNDILEVIHARNESLINNKDINQSDDNESVNRHNFDMSENQISSIIYNRNDENDDSDDTVTALNNNNDNIMILLLYFYTFFLIIFIVLISDSDDSVNSDDDVDNVDSVDDSVNSVDDSIDSVDDSIDSVDDDDSDDSDDSIDNVDDSID